MGVIIIDVRSGRRKKEEKKHKGEVTMLYEATKRIWSVRKETGQSDLSNMSSYLVREDHHSRHSASSYERSERKQAKMCQRRRRHRAEVEGQDGDDLPELLQ